MTEKQKYSLLCDFFLFFRENGERLLEHSIEGIVSSYLSAIAPTESKYTIDSIIQAFTSEIVTIDDIKSKSRKQEIVLARQSIMYVLKKLFGEAMTTRAIGEILNCDRATVVYGISKVEAYLITQQAFFENYKRIIRKLEGRDETDK